MVKEMPSEGVMEKIPPTGGEFTTIDIELELEEDDEDDDEEVRDKENS